MKLFIEFLIVNYLTQLAIAVIGNLVAGVAKSIMNNEFKIAILFGGIKDILMLFVGYAAFGAFAYGVKDVTFEDMQVFTGLFAFLTILIIAYKGNSLAIHFIELAKIPVPKVMISIDEKVKSMFEDGKPNSVFEGQAESDVVG